MNKINPWWYLRIAWFQALIGMLGSLYASEILGLIPCVLCWYQRIALYPLVIILAIGLWRRDKHVIWYSIPFALIGAGFGMYHTLLQWRVIKEGLTTCRGGISCSKVDFSWFGFINFPFLSWVGFVIILICLWLFYRANRNGSNNFSQG